MGILEILNAGCNPPATDFLVIGGYAVNAHGYPRLTFDLDILISKEQGAYWKNLMLQNGYKIFSEHENFLQFAPSVPNEMPVDFMLVNETTFKKMSSEAKTTVVREIAVKHPKLMHLIALKLHVIKQSLAHRYHHDLADVVKLLHINHVDVRGKELKELCEQFGNQEIYDTILREFK
jgi:hypothetical protein